MFLSRLGFAAGLSLAVCGCAAGGPQRASDIQNTHGISDDIAAVSMTQSDTRRARDPNLPSTLPRSSVTSYTP
jgi:hypothetical protein